MTFYCGHCGAEHVSSSACELSISSAVADVLQERRRQIEAEGYSTAHDDEHVQSELARAAASYLCRSDALMLAGTRVWPAGWQFKPADYRSTLVKALALGLAELERWDRTGAPASPFTVHSFHF